MKRMSVSKSNVEPSLPRAVPWISAAPTTPLKSVIVDISKPTAGGRTWISGSVGTGAKSALKPPGMGFGSEPLANAGPARSSSRPPRPATTAAVRRKNCLRDTSARITRSKSCPHPIARSADTGIPIAIPQIRVASDEWHDRSALAASTPRQPTDHVRYSSSRCRGIPRRPQKADNARHQRRWGCTRESSYSPRDAADSDTRDPFAASA
jgi:hypothetical protein